MMKNLVVVLALGAALTLIPSAKADSFGSNASGSNAVSNLKIDAGQAAAGAAVGSSGKVALRGAAQTGTVVSSRAAVTGGGYSLESLLNSRGGSVMSSDKADAVEEISSNDLSAMSGGLGGRKGLAVAGAGRFSFASKAVLRSTASVPKGVISQAATAVALAETPEPGSLFLLGTGLLCMALALFWKSAKRTTES
jgi:hypothetical protein